MRKVPGSVDDTESHDGDRKIFEVMTSTLSKGTFGSVGMFLHIKGKFTTGKYN
jgi:hypothetical protein